MLGSHLTSSWNPRQRSQARVSACLSLFTLSVLLVALSTCSEGGVQEPPPPTIRPSATLTRSFSDPPLEGQIVLTPAPDGTIWEFSIDFDDDGVIERSGTLSQPEEVDYSIAQVGVHEIVVTFSAEAGAAIDTLFAIVNDPEGSTLEEEALTGPPSGFIPGDGLVFASPFLYTGLPTEIQQRDPGTLEVVRSLRLPENVGNSLHGLAVSSDGRLYIANQHEVLEVRIPQLEILRTFPTEISSAFLIEVVGSERVYVGDTNELSVIDLAQGQVVNARTILSGIMHFDVDDEGSRLAVALGGSERRSILLLDARTLDDVWEVDLVDIVPTRVSFAPGGEVLYALGESQPADLHFFALHVRDGASLRHLGLGVGGPVGAIDMSNPVTRLGSDVIMATGKDTYVVDTESHLPVHRIDEPPGDPVFGSCECSVTSDDETRLFLLGRFGSLARIGVAERMVD